MHTRVRVPKKELFVKYHIISWNVDLKIWTLTMHPVMSLKDAKQYVLDESFANETIDIIHEMWLDCLKEWPEPGFFNTPTHARS